MDGPKVRHGVKTKPKNLTATPKNLSRDEEDKKEKNRGKQVEVQSTSTTEESSTTREAEKLDEAEVVEIVDQFRHGVLNPEVESFMPRNNLELDTSNLSRGNNQRQPIN
jgi:hypothetical protein